MSKNSIDEKPQKNPAKKSRKFWSHNGTILRLHTTSTVDTRKVRSKLKYKYILVFFLGLCIILTSVGVSGCSTSATSSANNYLLEASYDPYGMDKPSGPGVVNTDAYTTLNSNVANKTDLAVRISYFGTCTRSSHQSENTSYSEWYCSKNVTMLTDILSVPTQDPFNLIYLMNNIRTNHVNPAILIISACVNFIALVVLIVADLQNARLYFVSTWISVFACFMGLVGMVWQQASVDTAARIIENLSNNSIRSKAGPVPAGLGWTSIFILFCSGIGIVVLVMSERKTLSIIGDMDPKDIADLSGTTPMNDQDSISRHTVPNALSVADSRNHFGSRSMDSESDIESADTMSHRMDRSRSHITPMPVPYPILDSKSNSRIPHSYE